MSQEVLYVSLFRQSFARDVGRKILVSIFVTPFPLGIFTWGNKLLQLPFEISSRQLEINVCV